jgi:hypothetical protein
MQRHGRGGKDLASPGAPYAAEGASSAYGSVDGYAFCGMTAGVVKPETRWSQDAGAPARKAHREIATGSQSFQRLWSNDPVNGVPLYGVPLDDIPDDGIVF